ncbi:MAG: F0F1 ATP synthase subunit B [Pirellulales bacterium]
MLRIICAFLAIGWFAAAENCLAQAHPGGGEAEVENDAQIDAVDAHGHGDDHADGHGHGVGHDGASSDPSELKSDLAIFTFIIFVLLFAILYKFAWGPISTALDAREKGIKDNIEAAQRANDEGKVLLAQYEKKLADAQGEVKAIIEEARRDAEHTQQEILAKARADAQAERDRSLREIETATDQALKELAEKSTNLAVDLAGKIVQAQVKKSDHDRLIGDAVANFSSKN